MGTKWEVDMDTKWIPAAPLPTWKSWNNRARESFQRLVREVCIAALSCRALYGLSRPPKAREQSKARGLESIWYYCWSRLAMIDGCGSGHCGVFWICKSTAVCHPVATHMPVWRSWPLFESKLYQSEVLANDTDSRIRCYSISLPFTFLMRPRRRPKDDWVSRHRSQIWSAGAFFANTTAEIFKFTAEGNE